MANEATKIGLVALVGAGPGPAELLTRAGADWLARADVVVYDRLVDPQLLELAPPTAERLYVGKGPGEHTATQDQINRLLVEQAQAGKRVVRLKGGDCLVFGRGGEEAQALADAGVAFRIVPGVTAALAAGAYAGIPLTDRRCASSLALVTGHEDPAKTASSLDWAALARIDTVVFYMGVANLGEICRQLIAAGRRGDSPAAIVHRAASCHQQALVGTLDTLPDLAARHALAPPSLIIVSPAVALRERLAWLEKLPLFGQTVLVTRARAQASQLSARLTELGACVIEAPTVAIAEPQDLTGVDEALHNLGRYDWLVLTSPNGAEALMSRLGRLGLDARALAPLRIAAVGSGTAEALSRFGIRADLTPGRFTTAALGEALLNCGVAGKRFLLARADLATGELPALLKAGGGTVHELTLYRTIRPDTLGDQAREALRQGRLEWITFTSSSTVENFLALTGRMEEMDLTKIKLAAIGPVTAQTLKRHGLRPTVVAETHDLNGLLDALVKYAGQMK